MSTSSPSTSSPLNQSTGSVVCGRGGWRGQGGGAVRVYVSVLYIHLLIETMLQNFPSMNYRQPTSTSTVQISAEPANKTSKSRVARSSPIVKEAVFTAVQSGNHYGTEKKKK